VEGAAPATCGGPQVAGDDTLTRQARQTSFGRWTPPPSPRQFPTDQQHGRLHSSLVLEGVVEVPVIGLPAVGPGQPGT
jgi:hypothetical protein